MNRTALPVALIMAFSFLAAVSLVAANPFPTNPVISVTSPANKTYTVDSLILNVSIHTIYDGYYFTSTRQVSYSVDGTANASATETDYSYSNETHSSTTQYTATLTDLAEGAHYLTVYAKYDYDVHVITSHAVINFTIDTNSEPTAEVPEFPSLLILPLFLVATLLALLVRKAWYSKSVR